MCSFNMHLQISPEVSTLFQAQLQVILLKRVYEALKVPSFHFQQQRVNMLSPLVIQWGRWRLLSSAFSEQAGCFDLSEPHLRRRI